MVPLLAFLAWWAPRHLKQNTPFKGDQMKCAMGLRMIAEAKHAHLAQHPESKGQTIPISELQQYVGIPDITVCTNCPTGGSVRVNPIGELPTCSIAMHQKVFESLEAKFKTKGPTNHSSATREPSGSLAAQ